MKILVFSRTPWNTDNSFGNTYSNLFEGIKDLEFANIYCNYGHPKNRIHGKYFQIDEKSLIRNLFNSNIKTGREIQKESNYLDLSEGQTKIVNNIKKIRWSVFFWIRRFIWLIGRWRSKELKKFITDFDADLIFVPIYHSIYLNDIILYIKEITSVKMVAYVSDDVYTLKQFSLSPFFWLDRILTRRTIKKMVDKCDYLYVISNIQKIDYERIFQKECRILTKGADFDSFPALKKELNTPLKLVYTGNIGSGRWKSLESIGRELNKINHSGIKAQLYVYSTTPMTNKMTKALSIENSTYFMGGVSSEQVQAIQTDADILVHVEPFDLKGRLIVRHSFSTKIVDYFHSARCIFALGWKGAASIDYLIQNDAAIVACNEKEIGEKLQMLIGNQELVKEYGIKAFECGLRNHQIDKIQKKLYADLKLLVKPITQ